MLTIKHQNDVIDIFHTFINVFILDFEQVNVSWTVVKSALFKEVCQKNAKLTHFSPF